MWELSLRNTAGIKSGTATLESGLNTVQASNFKGKSSFIRAIQIVMGTASMGDRADLTEGASEGRVTLDTPETAYEVTLQRSETGAVTRHGDPYLTADRALVCARLFAFLGEDNEIRARVRAGEDLTDLLQRPIDIEDIDAQIADLRNERDSVVRRLETAERAAENLPSVTEAISRLESELKELRERRDQLGDRVGESPDDGSLSDDLADRRSEVSTAEQTVTRLEKQIERKETALAEKTEELETLEVPDEVTFAADIQEREERIDELGLQIDLLEGVHRANQRVLEEDEVTLVSSVESSLTADEFDCWVCGETTTAEDIEARLESLEVKLTELRSEKRSLTEEIEAVKREQEQVRQQRQTRRQLEETVGDLRADLDELRGELHRARDRRSSLQEAVDELASQVEAAETELNEQLTDIKAEIRTAESELDDQRSRRDELREQSQEATRLRTEKQDLTERIADLRNRKKKKQLELKEQFDTAMDEAISQFAPGFDGARLDVQTTADGEVDAFELVIARDGRETEIGALSEGERELVGIVVAVAGFRTFDVADIVPVILLDGISQLSADNLRRLIDYLDGASEMLVTTAYPEAGEFSGNTIRPTEWETISDEEAPVA
ncbi:hypothetical protein NDI56_17020 [Haloarcula sp. S1CR25-12]|uniref:Chromosome segregation protein SMC n=1 Tax=Haloarcula saliterrae TaxID=2950534 RepID=A0ABU2FFR2_9EURY|nr:archaea-specific SMC-related protein [Haloarcula sp. S1CR25-12]MDS0261103.1 hypothetical protein [Haloarcula sp. S1CR25-12]